MQENTNFSLKRSTAVEYYFDVVENYSNFGNTTLILWSTTLLLWSTQTISSCTTGDWSLGET